MNMTRKIFFIIFVLLLMLPVQASDMPDESDILTDGDRYFLSGDYESALREYRRASRLYPGSRTAYISQGATYIMMNRFPEALKAYREALRLESSDPVIHNNIGWVYLQLNRYDMAIKEFLEALRLSPEYVKAETNLGIVYLKMGEYEGAERIFRKLSKEYPGNANHFNDLAIALASQNKLVDAEEVLREGVKISPDNPTIEVNLGILAYLNHLPGKAIKHWKAALEIDPDFVWAQENLASAFYSMGNPEKAVAIWQKILKKYPGNISALSGLTGYYLGSGDLNRALLYAKKLIYHNPGLEFGYRNLGWIYIFFGNAKLARKEFEKAGGLSSPDPLVIYGIAISAEKAGDLNLAFEAYSRGLELVPDWGEAHYKIGMLYKKINRMSESLAEVEKAITYGFDSQEVQLEYAKLLLENNYNDQAAGILKDLLDKNPDLAEAEYLLARHYARKKMKETAIQHLKRACLLEDKYSHTWPNEPDLSPLIPFMKKERERQEPSGGRLFNT
ncbi:MAG: tetratricopeptide repeat protein [Candidatus Eremiobacteraeota bacterium]|nr:tetratricopeptide repeat protein [Candidatus Eremiobacteraeota bacterium]